MTDYLDTTDFMKVKKINDRVQQALALDSRQQAYFFLQV